MMQTVFRGGLVAAAVLRASLALGAEPPVALHGPPDVAKAVLQREMAFEKRSEAAGPAIAMREFMDPNDGLSFTGGEPAHGAEAIFQAHGGNTPAGRLTWSPREVWASSGNLAAVWGTFRFTPPVKDPKVVTGKYVTVWRKSAAGVWFGLVDIGSPD
jgi:hypothetical protein